MLFWYCNVKRLIPKGISLLMVRRKGLETLRIRSVKSSRAALTRAAFNCSSLFADIKIIRTRRCGSDYSSLGFVVIMDTIYGDHRINVTMTLKM